MNRRKYINDVIQHQKEDSKQLLWSHIEEKSSAQRLDRVVAEYTHDDNINKIIEKEQASFCKDNKAERDEILGYELDSLKREEIANIKRRQLLRENCEELRDLESQLKRAYIAKETRAQIAEREAIALETKRNEKFANAVLRLAWQDDSDFNRKLAEEEMLKKNKLMEEIQEQLMFKENLKRFEYEEFLREKKMLDDVVQRVHDEDQRDILKKKAEMARLKQDMLDFKEAQAAWKENKRRELEEEHKRIQELLQQQALKASKQHEEKMGLEKAKQEVRDMIAMKVYSDRKSKSDRDEIRNELLEQEEKEAIERRNREDLEKIIRTGIITRESLKRQMAEKQERKRQQDELDRKYKEELIAKMKEDERQERLECERRRQKMIENRKYIEAMMEDKRRKTAEDMLRRVQLEECERLEEEAKHKMIEEERINILKEHLPNVIGYIPPCTLKEDDWQKLGFSSLDEMRSAQMK